MSSTGKPPAATTLRKATVFGWPVSFGGARNGDFDPAHPGIVRLTRHPLLLAVWARAHIVPNGDLAHVILFALFALLGGRLVDRRKRRKVRENWARLDAARKAAALLPTPRSWPRLLLRFAFGASLYLGLLWLHSWLFGVRAFP